MKSKKSNLDKKSRHDMIKKILEEYNIRDHSDIKSILEQEGHFVSQPTISRDVKELGYDKDKKGEGIYVKTKDAVLAMKEDLLLELDKQLGFEVFLDIVGNNTVTFKVPRGYEEYISNLVYYVFESEIIGIIPGYGTFLVLTESRENAETIVGFFPGPEEDC